MADHDKNGLNRREFLRKAAVTGAVAWAIPVIQTVAASPAAAGTPFCGHSECIAACIAGRCGNLTGSARAACNQFCQSQCDQLCPIPPEGGAENRECTNPNVCDPSFWAVA
jgi:hypothetical protein